MTQPTEAECRHWHKVHPDWEWYEIDLPGRSYYAFGEDRELQDDRIGSPNPDRLKWRLEAAHHAAIPDHRIPTPHVRQWLPTLEACKQAAADLETAGHWWR